MARRSFETSGGPQEFFGLGGWQEAAQGRCHECPTRKLRRHAGRIGPHVCLLNHSVVQYCSAPSLHGKVRTTAKVGYLKPYMHGRDAFDVVILGEDCPRPKPNPDPYQRALELLKVLPHEAMIIEDSPSGDALRRCLQLLNMVQVLILASDMTKRGYTSVCFEGGIHTYLSFMQPICLWGLRLHNFHKCPGLCVCQGCGGVMQALPRALRRAWLLSAY